MGKHSALPHTSDLLSEAVDRALVIPQVDEIFAGLERSEFESQQRAWEWENRWTVERLGEHLADLDFFSTVDKVTDQLRRLPGFKSDMLSRHNFGWIADSSAETLAMPVPRVRAFWIQAANFGRGVYLSEGRARLTAGFCLGAAAVETESALDFTFFTEPTALYDSVAASQLYSLSVKYLYDNVEYKFGRESLNRSKKFGDASLLGASLQLAVLRTSARYRREGISPPLTAEGEVAAAAAYKAAEAKIGEIEERQALAKSRYDENLAKLEAELAAGPITSESFWATQKINRLVLEKPTKQSPNPLSSFLHYLVYLDRGVNSLTIASDVEQALLRSEFYTSLAK